VSSYKAVNSALENVRPAVTPDTPGPYI